MNRLKMNEYHNSSRKRWMTAEPRISELNSVLLTDVDQFSEWERGQGWGNGIIVKPIDENSTANGKRSSP